MVAVLVAVLGGVAMASVAAARRTQSAYPTYLATSRASDLELFVYKLPGAIGARAASQLQGELGALPLVRHVAAVPNVALAIREPSDTPQPRPIANASVNFIGSVRGASFTQDRPVVVAGRMSVPTRPDEIVASRDAATLLHWHVGERVALDAYTQAELSSSSTFPPPGVRPAGHVLVTLVGIVVFANEVAHDDADRFPTYVLITPALTRQLRSIETVPGFLLRLRNGSASVAAVESKIVGFLPPDSVYAFHETSIVEGQVERAVRPETIALVVFGLIAAAAALLLGAQALRRLVWARVGRALRRADARRDPCVARRRRRDRTDRSRGDRHRAGGGGRHRRSRRSRPSARFA